MLYLSGRRFLGSDLVIVLAICMHLFEGVVFATTPTANGTIGMAALLAIFRLRYVASAVLFISASIAILGHFAPDISPGMRLLALVPQQALLIVTALAALYATMHGSYADGIDRSWTFIACDQFPRMGAAIAYTGAIIARVRA